MSEPLILTPHQKDLGGGFMVRRLLPAAAKRAVGPFVFFDHMGPVVQQPADNFDVRPHPHIGLATVTYLFEGAMLHRDSLGSVQRIEPGAINLMTAGCGIVHSERRPPELAASPHRLHGLQLWTALPLADEECEPCFSHTPAAAIPVWQDDAICARVLMGSAFGLDSPVTTRGETLYVDFEAGPDAHIALPASPLERALYCVEGRLEVDGFTLAAQQLMVLEPNRAVTVRCGSAARFVMIGGSPLDGYRHMWWNFVSSRKERIEQAKADWRAQRMGLIPGETEFIPLPEA